MKKLALSGFILLTIFTFFAFLIFSPKALPQNISDLKDSDHININFKNITLDIEVAISDKKKQEGLMNRTFLGENNGMIFIFNEEAPRSFWMKNTLIPLDIIFLDKNFSVVTIHNSTKPNQTLETYSTLAPSQYVIETNGGWSIKNGLKIGDKFNL